MNKKRSETTIHCTYKTAATILLIIGCLFSFYGCAQLYRTIGLNEEQTATQVAEDQEATQQIIHQVRWTAHEIISTTVAGLGAILSGLLARWLGTERKITTAMITGIEAADPINIKESVQAKATAAGVETKLHARVVALT